MSFLIEIDTTIFMQIWDMKFAYKALLSIL